MQLPFYDEATLRGALTMADAIDAMRSAFAQLSDGRAVVPVRTGVQADDTVALFMPGWLPGDAALGAKVVSVAPGNAGRGLPAIHAVVLMLEPETGRPLALLDGAWLTALRTGAASGLATDLLSRTESKVLAVVGAGVQARTQIQAVLEVRDITEVRVLSRSPESARRMIAEFTEGTGTTTEPPERWQQRAAAARWVVGPSVEALVDQADIVVTATSSHSPVLPDRLSPGAHVNAVGAYTPAMRELPTALVVGATVYVDQRGAALAEAGDLIIPISEGAMSEAHIAAELGEVVLGRHPGRSGGESGRSEVTVFKSVGSAAQDLAVAARALEVIADRG